MIRSLAVAVTAALFSLSAVAAPPPALAKVDEEAPNFKTLDVLHNKPIELKALRGKPVVLEWNNFGCPFVRKHYQGNMQKLQQEAMADGVQWISINSSAEGKEGYLSDSKAVIAALREHDAAPSAYITDAKGEIGRSYGATATPHMFVIDKEGTLVYAGAIDDKPTPDVNDIASAKNYVRGALAALAAGKKPQPSQTRAYGCGVKYAF
jgi:peroxiredoxin